MTKPGMLTKAATMLAVAATVCVAALPAGAQFFGDRYPFDQRPRRQGPPQQQFFPFFGGGGERESPQRQYRPDFVRPVQPAQPVDSSKAPAPRKQDKPPSSTLVVVGDSMADWLAYGLDETFNDTPETGIVRKVRASAGLIRYEPRSDTPEWSQAVKDLLAPEKPSAIVVMLGINDRQSLREHIAARPGVAQPGQAAPADAHRAATPATYEFRTDKWTEQYAKRVDDMIAALKAKGAPVLWVGLPSIRGPRSTSDISYLNDIFRTRAEKAGIVYVDVWDGFVDESGRFTVQGPDFEGQTRRLRAGDGVHFTKAGAIKLAHYVQRELQRLVAKAVGPVPVALPTPAESAPAKPGEGASSRPVAGPVVPLSITGGKDEELLGGGGAPSTSPGRAAKAPPAVIPDPTVSRVLTRGESLAAPIGRADDFVWPRRGYNASGEPTADPAALPPPPAADAKAATKASTGRSDDKKSKTEAKAQPQPAQDAPRARRSPRADLGGGPRPPLPVGSR